jgi:uroporphyrinogen III methyltransferase/synthase
VPSPSSKSARPITAKAQSLLSPVALVGAGPGDPGLITVRGSQLLSRADVVIYDHLANPRLLALAPQARHIYVGKQSGAHALQQQQINDLLIAEAKKSLRVVRLKGGDPFVFGRGGEECQALGAAGVPFEIVPGITAAIAAAAYAGIPATHRDFNSSFTLVTGNEKASSDQDSQDAELDWAALARLPCVAFYMGVASLGRICERLIENGMPANTPAATIAHGTTPRQQTITATLADLPQQVTAADVRPPAVTIVGQVVQLRQALNWFERRPLFGSTIVVTRTRHQAGELSAKLEEQGAFVIEAPTIELTEPADWSAVDSALRDLHKANWAIFTSANGAAAVRNRLSAIGLDSRAFGRCKIAAIGQSTAAAVTRELCLRVDLCPAQFVAEALADEFEATGEVAGRHFVLLRADIARPVLADRLRAAGAAEVKDVSVYETRRATSLPPELLAALNDGQVDWITFASSASASNFVSLLKDAGLKDAGGAAAIAQLSKTRFASIGPITSATMRDLGLEPAVEAPISTIDSLVAAIIQAQQNLPKL